MPSIHARANDRFAEFFVISVVKAVTRKLPFDFVADGDKESRNIVPKKIDELIVGNDDQNVGFGLFQILAQNGEMPPQHLAEVFSAARMSAGSQKPLRRHAVVKIHEIFPLASRLKQDIRCMARSQSGNKRHRSTPQRIAKILVPDLGKSNREIG